MFHYWVQSSAEFSAHLYAAPTPGSRARLDKLINRFQAANLEISRLLYNSEFHYSVPKGTTLVPIRARGIRRVPTRPVTFGSILLWSSHLRIRLGFPGGFASGIPTNILYAICLCLISYTPSRSQFPWFLHPNNILWEVQIMKVLIMQISPLLHLRSKFSHQRPILKHSQYAHLLILM